DTTGTDTTTGGDMAPVVIATDPANAEEGVDPATSISVTFSEVMDAATVTTNTADTSCSGTFQVSTDGFATCVRMSAAPASNDDTTFTITPMDNLASVTIYDIRILADVTDMGGTPMGVDYDTLNGFLSRYFHTIVIDGNNDFTANEHFNTSSPGHHGHVAWDADYVYIGMEAPDLVGSDPQIWFVAYLGGAMGTNTGVLYNSQQPMLPFDARWHLRWKASDDYGGTLEWNGNNWIDAGFGPIVGSDDVAVFGSFVEMRIAWADIENPDLLDLHLGMLREQAFNESCWAAVPGGSYSDGYDPDYSEFYQFDVLGSTLPSDHLPM
ncbi:MAG: Ig-like domain-containing protein, partial [Myxococcales bacterium]|nr:Ig-like domain-containing protein [Myxococcales bacterium]